MCCKRAIVAIDPTATVDDSGTDKQAGGVTFYSGYGDATHTGTIVDFANFTAPTGEINDASYNTDLADADTLREMTTRYDARHRPTHRTVWLVPAYEQGGTGGDQPAESADRWRRRHDRPAAGSDRREARAHHAVAVR